MNCLRHLLNSMEYVKFYGIISQLINVYLLSLPFRTNFQVCKYLLPLVNCHVNIWPSLFITMGYPHRLFCCILQHGAVSNVDAFHLVYVYVLILKK